MTAKILLQLDCDQQPSTFDAIVALDAGAETLLRHGGDPLERSVSWKVFEDRKYPYDGGESKDLVAEPRRIAGLDADGDRARDLVMLSQDRLVIYLGREAAGSGQAGIVPARKEQP